MNLNYESAKTNFQVTTMPFLVSVSCAVILLKILHLIFNNPIVHWQHLPHNVPASWVCQSRV